jgi:hypothetical protein
MFLSYEIAHFFSAAGSKTFSEEKNNGIPIIYLFFKGSLVDMLIVYYKLMNITMMLLLN